MLKYLVTILIIVLLFSPQLQAADEVLDTDNLGGEFGVEYSTLRDNLNWYVGLNYTVEMITAGFTIQHWTTTPHQSYTFPYVGFAAESTYYLWYGILELTDNLDFKFERYCEHWMKQSDSFEDYVGVKAGLHYEF